MATKDVMIDIETLSTDADALVVSIGAVEFEYLGHTQQKSSFERQNNDGPWFGDEYFARPSIMEQLLLPRSISMSTQLFWKEQPGQARDHWCGPGVPRIKVGEALEGLAKFVAGAPRVWANGAVFDFGILESLYRQFQMPIPWKYNAIRDARTVYDIRPEIRTRSSGDTEYVLHHPIGDCKEQIIRLWERGLVST